jgi:hypothetical protein
MEEGDVRTVPCIHLAVLPLHLREVQRHVRDRRVHVDNLMPGATDDRRVGDHRRHLPAKLPRCDRQPPRPPPLPRPRQATKHRRLTARTWIDHRGTLQN